MERRQQKETKLLGNGWKSGEGRRARAEEEADKSWDGNPLVNAVELKDNLIVHKSVG